MKETPQQRAEVVFCQYVLARQDDPGYADFLRALRLRLDEALGRCYEQTGGVGHCLSLTWPDSQRDSPKEPYSGRTGRQ